jgi:hypothetical protein
LISDLTVTFLVPVLGLLLAFFLGEPVGRGVFIGVKTVVPRAASWWQLGGAKEKGS